MSDSQAINATRREPLGARILGEQVCSFLVWAPHASRVEVCITQPQEHKILMQPAGSGYFHAVVADLPLGTLYRYRLNGEKERPDPASRYQPRGVHGPSQIVEERFGWTDSEWRGIPLENYVFYELHVGTFTQQGNFEAITPRLPTLKKLGVTAIELMPVAQFPGDRNWGYDGVYPYAVQASYGGPVRAEGLSQCLSSPGNRSSARCGLQPPWSGGKLPCGFRSLFHGPLQDALGKGHQFRRCWQRRSPAIFHRECSAVDYGIPHRRASTRRHPRDCGSFRANVPRRTRRGRPRRGDRNLAETSI